LRGPLHGVPVGVKNVIDIVGMTGDRSAEFGRTSSGGAIASDGI
jgi:hypothetical protein